MKQILSSTPVVILRSGHHGGLGIVRSLGRFGVPVYCVDSDRWEPAFLSRYCRGRFLMKLGSGTPDRSINSLLEISQKLGSRPVLIPTTDSAAMWVADNAQQLHAAFSFPRQDSALVRTLCDKARMQNLARSCGVATARSVVPRSIHDLDPFLETVTFPVMLKATVSERVRVRAGGTKFLVNCRAELLSVFAKAFDVEQPNLILQEFIPGEDWMFDGYFDATSQCLFGVTGKKIRRFPVDTGVTSLGMCQRNEVVEKITSEFMKAIGYQGILDIGYRRDQRDGRYKVLDVNPRIGCTFRLLAAADGMDVARALYMNLTAQPVPVASTPEGRRWMVEDFDFISAFRLWRSRSITLREWVTSFTGIQETACFAADDLLPFLFMPVTDSCEFLRWLSRQVMVRSQ